MPPPSKLEVQVDCPLPPPCKYAEHAGQRRGGHEQHTAGLGSHALFCVIRWFLFHNHYGLLLRRRDLRSHQFHRDGPKARLHYSKPRWPQVKRFPAWVSLSLVRTIAPAKLTISRERYSREILKQMAVWLDAHQDAMASIHTTPSCIRYPPVVCSSRKCGTEDCQLMPSPSSRVEDFRANIIERLREDSALCACVCA